MSEAKRAWTGTKVHWRVETGDVGSDSLWLDHGTYDEHELAEAWDAIWEMEERSRGYGYRLVCVTETRTVVAKGWGDSARPAPKEAK